MIKNVKIEYADIGRVVHLRCALQLEALKLAIKMMQKTAKTENEKTV